MPDAWKYDPLYIIDEYGTDALRYTLTTSSTPGNDMNLDSRRLEGARNFANKMWQASRFILMNLGDEDLTGDLSGLDLTVEDRWILSRIHRLDRRCVRPDGNAAVRRSRAARARFPVGRVLRLVHRGQQSAPLYGRRWGRQDRTAWLCC